MQTLLITPLVLLGIVTVLWCVATTLRDVSIVDCFWGAGFAIVAWLVAGLNGPNPVRVQLLVGLTSLWGLRLAGYLTWRRWGKPEDHRYAAMREAWGPQFVWVSLFTVFLLQGVLIWFISIPLQIAAIRQVSAPLSWLDFVGFAIFCVGFAFESIGDWQMARFKSQLVNAGKVMDRGLWRYTRHPNYFGDFCVWWGLYLIAAGGGALLTVLSPIMISVLLLRVSGVTLLERSIGGRIAGYDDYKARTSAFFPWSPRVLR